MFVFQHQRLWRKMVGSIFRRGEIYYIAYCINGKQIKESTKQSKYKVAKEMLANIEAEISQGKTPYSAFRNATFEDLVELIKADYMKRGRKSWDTTEIRVNNLKRFFKGYTTSRITTKAIDKYIAMRLEEGLSEVTVNRELAALRRMLNLGYKATPRLVADVPAITTFKEDNARQGFLEYEDFLVFLDHLPEWNEKLHSLWLLHRLEKGCNLQALVDRHRLGRAVHQSSWHSVSH